MKITDEQKSVIRDALKQALRDSYDCTRAWSAWSYGTMSQDDFSHIPDDDNRIEEITLAVIYVLCDAQKCADEIRETIHEQS